MFEAVLMQVRSPSSGVVATRLGTREHVLWPMLRSLVFGPFGLQVRGKRTTSLLANVRRTDRRGLRFPLLLGLRLSVGGVGL